ncbi:DMT family transporter [Tahibacter amnicola]|uniref:DMT family transporter n=1 Tax=Tahibacter amnicola TaxID=2976241 RepID=A0ABY6BHJ3_9GAMM|nr:DMT family transporter [Tahibacter amnicola]UXI69242.1 DMT family transporter [Tahibacter amnicola]
MGLGEALSILSALAWSAGVIIYKRLGESLPPMQLNLMKNLIVLGLLVPSLAVFADWPPPTLPLSDLVITLVSGVLGIAVADTLYFRALNQLGAARTGILGNFFSPFVILLSFVFLHERLGPIQIVGFVLVTAGVLTVGRQTVTDTVDRRAIRIGIATGIAAIFLMAVAIVMVKPVLEAQPFVWVVSLRLVGGVTAMALAYAAFARTAPSTSQNRGPIPWRTLLAGAFVGQYLSMVLWLGGYKYTRASIAAILNETTSIFIVLLAWLFLGEPLTRRKLVGVGLTVSGVACMLLA